MLVKNFPILALLVLLANFTACGPDKVVFRAEKEIADAGWTYGDTLDFTFQIQDTSTAYAMYLEFSHADSYPLQNVYLKLSTLFPDGKRPVRVRPFDFYNAQGVAHGKCTGGTCQVRLNLQDKAYFKQPGKYTLTLEQYTRMDSLPGVKTVGLVLEKI